MFKKRTWEHVNVVQYLFVTSQWSWICTECALCLIFLLYLCWDRETSRFDINDQNSRTRGVSRYPGGLRQEGPWRPSCLPNISGSLPARGQRQRGRLWSGAKENKWNSAHPSDIKLISMYLLITRIRINLQRDSSFFQIWAFDGWTVMTHTYTGLHQSFC